MKSFRSIVLLLSLCAWSVVFPLAANVALTEADLVGAYRNVSYGGRTAVHDPSIVIDSISDPSKTTYYVFGSHMAVSKTADLRQWTSNVCGGERENATLYGRRQNDGTVKACSYNDAFKQNEVSTIKVMRDGVARDTIFGTYNAAAWSTAIDNFTVRGNQWAADVVYNPTMGKWLHYVSLNGSKWNSVIVCMAADRIEGPYVYQGPVIFTGFNIQSGSPDFTASDMPHVLGNIKTLPERYARGDKWGTFWPHAIDPNVFYDAEGKLWMAYGSWSGGIYMLELDENTGLRDYTISYPAVNNSNANVSSDPYFGKKIAGGYYVSGEGAYIQRIGDYYYLFMSYGFYSPEGGYEMRVFRSENPDGPYRDCSSETGTSATYSSYQMNYGLTAATSRGMKLMGGYRWDPMPVAEIAQGHNSAMVERDGKAYVVYHTKFHDGTVGHSVRVHRLLLNSEGWPCAAPYEHRGSDSLAITNDGQLPAELCGTYQVIRHNYKVDYENYAHSLPSNITLHPDGSVTGAYKGKWEVTPGSSLVTLVLDYVTYRGNFIRQTIDYTDIPALCFTVVSSSSGTVGATRALSVWGSNADSRAAIAYTVDRLSLPFSDGEKIYSDLVLPTRGYLGTSLTWSSSDPTRLGHDGKIGSEADGEEVMLTLTISKDGYSYERSYRVTVAQAQGDICSGLAAYYDFEEGWSNRLDASQIGVPRAEASGTKPQREKNSAKGGMVLRQHFGYPSASSSSYVQFSNPLQGKDLSESGATVSMYVLRTADNEWDAVWAFLDTDAADGIDGRCYLTANTYLGFNGTGGWFDANYPSTDINVLETNVWHLVSIAFTATGWSMYIDGVKRYDEQNCLAFSSGSGFSDYASVTRLLTSASDFYLGYGSWWGSAPLLIDDVTLYARALSDEDMMTLYLSQQSGTFVDATHLEEISFNKHIERFDLIYDLQGRRVEKPGKGLYIINGKRSLLE